VWMCGCCVCVYVCTSKPVVPMGQQKNKNKKKQQKTKTKNINKTTTTTTTKTTATKTKKKNKKKKTKKKTKKQKKKSENITYFVGRQVVFLTLAVLKCPTVCFGLSVQNHTVGHFLHSSESPKSETLINLKGCQNRRHLKGALLDGIVEGDPTTPPSELHTPKAIQ